jgi:hypothetical protein
MNGDGKKDLIMGENNAQIFYYENTGTDADPVFSGYQAIQSNGVPLDLYSGSRLWVNDWDEDGTPDLIASDFNGYVHVFMADLSGTVEEASAQPQNGLLVTPAVNPAHGTFNINIQIPSEQFVELRIYDSAGRLVASQDTAGFSQGINTVMVDAGSMATGIYTVVAATGTDTSSCRIVLTD